MTLLPVLIAALTASVTPCAQPPGGRPHYVIPGALSDVPFYGQLTLDAYAPAGEPRPAAIIIHGSQGTKSTHVTQLFEVLDRAGFAWFSVDYRSTSFIRWQAPFTILRTGIPPNGAGKRILPPG